MSGIWISPKSYCYNNVMYVFVIKVAGILEAFSKNISMEDAMFHGHWRSLNTPGIYCHQNKAKKVDNITVE